MTKTDLAGLTFVKRRRKEGEESIHFPPTASTEILPFVSFTKAMNNMKFDDGTPMKLERKCFDACRFHTDSRTFHGILDWKSRSTHNDSSCTCCDGSQRLIKSNKWEYILSFSSDFRYIGRGVLILHRNPCRNVNCRNIEYKFPLDGEWFIEDDDEGTRSTVKRTAKVHGNVFSIQNKYDNNNVQSLVDLSSKIAGYIDYTPASKPALVWINGDRNDNTTNDIEESHRQNASDDFEFDFASRPEGPAVGETIKWLGSSNRRPKMLWRRKSITPDDVPLQVIKFGTDQRLLYHQLGVLVDHLAAVPAYIPTTLWGNVFCQVGTVGLASYHFNEDETAYISYEHEETSTSWGNLDDGQPIPARINFTDTQFDSERRIFRGTIDWEGTHDTTWHSSRWWK
jgi:hypothetical protein